MKRAVVLSLAGFLSVSSVLAGPPAGTPTGGGRPDFAGSGGRPDFAGGAASTSSSAGGSSSYGQSTAGSASGGRSSSRGNASNAGSFPSNANAGGLGLSHAAPQAQGTLTALDTAFSEGEISMIREYFTARAHENKPSGEAASTATTFNKGQKLSPGTAAETLPADLLAKLPNRPGLTYLRVGDTILMLAGPDDVIVDIIDANTLDGGG